SSNSSIATARALAPRAERSAGSPIRSASAAARPSASPSGTVSPVSPWRTASRVPGTRVATTGIPIAMGSSAARGIPSLIEVSTGHVGAGEERGDAVAIPKDPDPAADAERLAAPLAALLEHAPPPQEEAEALAPPLQELRRLEQHVVVLDRLE